MSTSEVAAGGVSGYEEARLTKRRDNSRTLSLTRILFVATLFVAPLPFGSVNPWAWTSLGVLAVLLLLLWGAGCVQQGALSIVWSPLFLPAALFLLLGVGQFTGHFTSDPFATREFLLKLVTDLILFFLAVQLWTTASESALNWFGLVVAIYLFSFALFAIFQFFTGNGLIYWTVKSGGETAFGPYVNHNHYAGLIEMLIPLVAAYVLGRAKNDGLRVLIGFAVLTGIASALLSGSRGGFISLILETFILIIILFWRRPKGNAHRLAVAAAVLITVVGLFFFWIDPGQVSKRLATVVNPQGEPDFAIRIITARDSLGIFRDYPWIGAGLGSFATAFPRYQSIPSDLIWDHAHNDYAEILAESGLVGGILVLWGLVLFFCLAFKNLDGRVSDDLGWMQLGAALACCGLLVHSFVDFNLHIPANAAWFSVCVGMAHRNFVSSNRRARPGSDRVN